MRLLLILAILLLPGCILSQVNTNKDNIKTVKESVDKHFVEDHGKPPTDPLKETESSGGVLGFLGKILTLGGNIPGEVGLISTLLGGLIVAKNGEKE